MKKFITKSGETAYVPSQIELKIIITALNQLRRNLPSKGEIVDG